MALSEREIWQTVILPKVKLQVLLAMNEIGCFWLLEDAEVEAEATNLNGALWDVSKMIDFFINPGLEESDEQKVIS